MRLGLIGAGAVATLHALAALRLPEVRLTAVCDLSETAASRVAAPYGARVFVDYRDLLDCGEVDAVIVNTPHALHRAMAIDAAERGLHALVEKPFGVSLADCDAMQAASESARTVLVVGQIQHYLPEKLAVAAALAGGELGEVHLVQDSRSTDYRPGTRSDWFFSPALAGGGALMNIGGHCLDRSVWLSGSTAVSVSATTMDRFGVGVETDGLVTLQLANGGMASVTVLSDPPERKDEVSIVGDRGVITANARDGAFLRKDGRTTTLSECDPDGVPDAFFHQLADFVAVVGGAKPSVPLAHSRHVVELILGAYESARAGGAPVPVGKALTRRS